MSQANSKAAYDLFPKEYFKTEDEYMGIYKHLDEFAKDKNAVKKEEIDKDTDLKKTKCNRIFAIFLFNMCKSICPKAYREYSVFIAFLRKALNAFGWKLKERLVKENKIDENSTKEREKEYCEENTGENILEISNEFIIEYLPTYIHECKMKFPDVKNFILVGNTEEQMKNTIKLTHFFCNWLFANKYTNSKLVLSNDIPM